MINFHCSVCCLKRKKGILRCRRLMGLEILIKDKDKGTNRDKNKVIEINILLVEIEMTALLPIVYPLKIEYLSKMRNCNI